MYQSTIDLIRSIYSTDKFIPLHEPSFSGNDKKYVEDAIESTYVSSVGAYVDRFEKEMQDYTGATKAVSTVNGTAALHVALYAAGVNPGDLVITQALTFVATCNALHHMGAEPLLVDVNKTSLGLCPQATSDYLEEHTFIDDSGKVIHRVSEKRIAGIVPMHTFGHPAELDEIITLASDWGLPVIEDAAESVGSFYKSHHTGTIGNFGALSFNGNKIITTGGGGMVLCRSGSDGARVKHLTTTAKVPHPYEFYHDEAGFNYRMPNLNAALGCAQLEALPGYLKQKRNLANRYAEHFANSEFQFVSEPPYAQSNYWLNAIICPNAQSRNEFLQETNAAGVMTRPIWKLMHRLPMYAHCLKGNLANAEWLEARVVNLPSSVLPEGMT